MKKSLLLVLILLQFPVLLFSQVKVTLGTPYGVVDAKSKNYFSKGNEIMTVKIIDDKKFVIQKFDAKSLTQLSRTESKDMPKGFDLEEVGEVNGKYYVFYSLYDKPNTSEQLFAREIDFAQGAFAGEGKLLVKTTKKIAGTLAAGAGFAAFNIHMTDKFQFEYSFDGSKMLVKYRLKPEVKDDAVSYDIFGMYVFEGDFNLMWEKEVKLPYTEKKMDNIDFSVDGNGNVYELAKIYKDNSTSNKDRDGDVNYRMEVLTFKAKTAELTKTPIELKGKFINSVSLFESASDYMVCAGFYNKKFAPSGVDGIFSTKIGKNGKVSDISTYEIPLEVLNDYVSNRTKKRNEKKEEKGKAVFDDLKFKHVAIDNDGGMILMGEQYYLEKIYNYSSSGGSTVHYISHYNNLLITKIDVAGKLVWMKKIPKKQSVNGIAQGGCSFKYIRSGKNHYFLFLDNAKNINLPDDKEPYAHLDGAGGYITAVSIDDATGAEKKTSVADLRDIQGTEVYQFTTNRILNIGSNEMVVELYKKHKQDVLIKVSFE